MMSDDEIDRAIIHGDGDVERAIFETVGRIARAPRRDTDVEVVVHSEQVHSSIADLLYDADNVTALHEWSELDARAAVFDRAAFDRAVELVTNPFYDVGPCPLPPLPSSRELEARVWERGLIERSLRERVRTMGLHIPGGYT